MRINMCELRRTKKNGDGRTDSRQTQTKRKEVKQTATEVHDNIQQGAKYVDMAHVGGERLEPTDDVAQKTRFTVALNNS